MLASEIAWFWKLSRYDQIADPSGVAIVTIAAASTPMPPSATTRLSGTEPGIPRQWSIARPTVVKPRSRKPAMNPPWRFAQSANSARIAGSAHHRPGGPVVSSRARAR